MLYEMNESSKFIQCTGAKSIELLSKSMGEEIIITQDNYRYS